MRGGHPGVLVEFDWVKLALAFVALIVATILAASTSYCYRYFIHTKKQILQAYNERRSPRVLEEMVGLLHAGYWASPLKTYKEVRITIPASRSESALDVFKWSSANHRWQLPISAGR